MATALLPLKDLVEAKSRLAGLLRPSERRALAQAMAEDVLAVLRAHPRLQRVVLVSDDPGARLLAHEYDAQCWSERGLGCRGLNPVLQAAAGRLAQAAGDDVMLVLHADLPLLGGADIDAALDACTARQVLVVAPDRHGRGTNLLAFHNSVVPAFCFGADSCAAHQRRAREQGLAVQLLRRPGLALDLDEPADLAALLAQAPDCHGGRSRALLQGAELGARLRTALASLPLEAVAPAAGAEQGS